MAKYIERDYLIDMISERNRNTCNGKMSCIQMKRMVESIPATDVVPVVRCKDCVYYDEEDISLAKAETCPAGSTIEFEITCLDKNLENMVVECLNYGSMRGLGQWRNSGKGVFTWEKAE